MRLYGGTRRSRSGFADAAFGSIKGANLRLPENATARASSPGKADADLPPQRNAGRPVATCPTARGWPPLSLTHVRSSPITHVRLQDSRQVFAQTIDILTSSQNRSSKSLGHTLRLRVASTLGPRRGRAERARASVDEPNGQGRVWTSRTGKGECGRAERARASVERAFL